MYKKLNTYTVLVTGMDNGQSRFHVTFDSVSKIAARRMVREISVLSQAARDTDDYTMQVFEGSNGKLAAFQPHYVSSVYMTQDEEWVEDETQPEEAREPETPAA